MKKIISLVLVLSLFVCVFATFASAAPADDIIAKAKSTKFSKSFAGYEITTKNILKQITISDDQKTQLIALIDEFDKKMAKDNGPSLHEYTDDEQVYILETFDKACKILGLTYEIKNKGVQGQYHDGDIFFAIYSNGKLIGELDGDVVKQTGGSSSALPLAGFAGFALLVASAVVIFRNKKLIKE